MNATSNRHPYGALADLCRSVDTLLKLVPQVLGLQDQLREAVQNGDMETCHGICRITVALGENQTRWELF